jgi:hypothetical protein
MKTQINLDAFYEVLKAEYTNLFAKDSDYAYSASKTSPEALARRMTLSLYQGTADKDGKAIKAACKHFGIPHTYKAIRSFLSAQ